MLKEIIEKSAIVDLDRRLTLPFSFTLWNVPQSGLHSNRASLFLRGAANRIKKLRRCTRDACKTHPQQLVNLSASFTSSSFQCNVLAFSLFLPPSRLSFFSRGQSGKKEERQGRKRGWERERESPFQSAKVACAIPPMPKEYTPRALCTPSRRLTYLLVGSLLCSFYPEKARRESERNKKKCGNEIKLRP